jgi:uncharacterized membrane protein YdjX (TVP38/TMEM64 family)
MRVISFTLVCEDILNFSVDSAMQKNTSDRLKAIVLCIWLLGIGIALYHYFFKPDFLEHQIALLFESSLAFGYGLYLILGALRGLTLIPVTYFIIIGLLFFPPLPLYLLTVTGVMISSATIYYFSNFLNLDAFFEKRYPKQIAMLKEKLQKNELPIVIGWSLFPLAPTDVICYVCGAPTD